MLERMLNNFLFIAVNFYISIERYSRKSKTCSMANKTNSNSSMDDEVSHNEAMPHKGHKIRSYTLDFKLKAIEYAENNSINAAANKFNTILIVNE